MRSSSVQTKGIPWTRDGHSRWCSSGRRWPSGCGGDDEESSATTTEAAATTGSSATAGGTLEGEVGPGFDIEVSQNGEDAEEVVAGTYTLKVEDKSDQHNFHLMGPGVDEEVTDVAFIGEKAVTVTLEPGTYTYQCDPHASNGMKGTFEVT
jgi:plastocyanin